MCPLVTIWGTAGGEDLPKPSQYVARTGLCPSHTICVPSQRPPAHYPVFPRTTGDFPNSDKPQGNQLLISTVDGLNNTVFVCKVTNALGSGQGQEHIFVKGEQSSDKEERVQEGGLLRWDVGGGGQE